MRRSSVIALVLALLAGACRSRVPAEGPAPPAAAATAASAVPEARTEVSASVIDDGILVAGGLRADGTATARVDRYDPGTGRWSVGPDLPEALHHAGMAAFGGRIYVAGGYMDDGAGGWVGTARVWSLGGEETRWRAEPPLATARGALGLAATAQGLVAFGGTDAGVVLASVEVLAAGAKAWRAAPPMGRAREHLAAAARHGRVFAIAGRAGGLETNTASVESFDPGRPTEGWRPEPSLVRPRGGIAAATVGDAVCVAGGEEPAGTIASLECLGGDQWREVATLVTPRHGLGVVAGGGRNLHVLAGGPRPGLFVSDAHEVVAIP